MQLTNLFDVRNRSNVYGPFHVLLQKLVYHDYTLVKLSVWFQKFLMKLRMSDSLIDQSI